MIITIIIIIIIIIIITEHNDKNIPDNFLHCIFKRKRTKQVNGGRKKNQLEEIKFFFFGLKK
jgi:hypothetical protein